MDKTRGIILTFLGCFFALTVLFAIDDLEAWKQGALIIGSILLTFIIVSVKEKKQKKRDGLLTEVQAFLEEQIVAKKISRGKAKELYYDVKHDRTTKAELEEIFRD